MFIFLWILYCWSVPIRNEIPNIEFLGQRTLFWSAHWEIRHFKESEEVRGKSSPIDSELLHCSLFDIVQSFKRLSLNMCSATYREMNRYGDDPFAHQSHNLILDGHETDLGSTLQFPQHFSICILKVFSLARTKTIICQLLEYKVEGGQKKIWIRVINMQKDNQSLNCSNRSRFISCIALFDQLKQNLID